MSLIMCELETLEQNLQKLAIDRVGLDGSYRFDLPSSPTLLVITSFKVLFCII